jgi:cytochrome bd-type quinol oxidase subunit 2
VQDLTAFYGVISGLNFTLLGLWWVAVQELKHLRDRQRGTGRMAYVVSLQFVLPGTAALLSQVAPKVSGLWRGSFTLAGLLGVLGIVLLAPRLVEAGSKRVSTLLLLAGVPIYLLVTAVAAFPSLDTAFAKALNGAQLEGVLFSLLILISTQTAWVAAMSRWGEDEETPSARTGSMTFQ